jgi:hypothetical protein
MEPKILLKAPTSKKCMMICNGSWSTSPNIEVFLKSMIDIIKYPNYILYNDQVANKKACASSKAHAKGVLMWNDSSIMWLIHSVPKWPMSCRVLDLPLSGIIYGQSFVQVNMPICHLNNVLYHLRIMNVNIYNENGNNEQSLNIHNIHIDQYFITPTLSHVAKSYKWSKDIYDDFLIELFGGGEINIECWMRPTGKDTTLGNNVEVIRWPDGTLYNEQNDHSKFCISKNPEYPYLYIGDINHQASQKHRGGGGFVINNLEIWKIMSNLVFRE